MQTIGHYRYNDCADYEALRQTVSCEILLGSWLYTLFFIQVYFIFDADVQGFLPLGAPGSPNYAISSFSN